MFKKLDRYIIWKFLGTFFYALLLIISISIVFDFSEKLDDFIDKQAPLKAIIFDYYLNFIPFFANLFSPLFTFIAVIYFTSRMANDTEITAILSSGISYARLVRPYMISAFILASLSFALNNFVIPPANRVRLEFEETYILNPYHNMDRNIHKQIKPGIFIYMESYNSFYNIGYKFTIEKYEGNQLVSKLSADHIRWDSIINKWNINTYTIRTLDGLNESLVHGKSIDSAINITPSDFTRRVTAVEKMNFFQLNDFIDEQIMQGADNVNAFLIEKYKRIASPFATFILTLIGISVAARKVRGGIGLHIGIGILLSFSYILFMQFSTVFSINGNVSPLLAVWIPNIVFAFIALYLYRKAPK